MKKSYVLPMTTKCRCTYAAGGRQSITWMRSSRWSWMNTRTVTSSQRSVLLTYIRHIHPCCNSAAVFAGSKICRQCFFYMLKNNFFFPVRKFLPMNYPSLSLRHVCLWWRPRPLNSACADGLKLGSINLTSDWPVIKSDSRATAILIWSPLVKQKLVDQIGWPWIVIQIKLDLNWWNAP